MPYKDKPVEKMYYSMGEVSKIIGENPSLIRFWEKEFSILTPKKNSKGNRLFTSKDLENLKLIHYLVKEKGYTLNGAKEYLKTEYKNTKDKLEIINSLERTKEFLEELRNNLEENDENAF